jgi:hypothetical protein
MRLDTSLHFRRFLFHRADPRCVAWFRLAFALLLAFAFWPRGLVAAPNVGQWPWIESLYPAVFLTTPYRCLMYGGIVLLGLGWRPRIVGAVLICLLLPHDFLNRGQQSRQVLLLILVFISLLPATPVWRWRQLRELQFPAGPMWPIRLLQILLTLLYALNAYVKASPEFLSGEILMALSTQPNFLVDLTSGYLRLGPVSIPVALLAVGTVVLETWLAIGFWIPRLRWPTAALGVAFHLSLKFVVRIFMLDYATMLLYLAFLLPFTRDGSKLEEGVTGRTTSTPDRGPRLAAPDSPNCSMARLPLGPSSVVVR